MTWAISSRMLKKTASLFCSFGLFGLSGLFGWLNETNQMDQMDQIDQTDLACATGADHRSSSMPK